jgi:hypothetical protein
MKAIVEVKHEICVEVNCFTCKYHGGMYASKTSAFVLCCRNLRHTCPLNNYDHWEYRGIGKVIKRD